MGCDRLFRGDRQKKTASSFQGENGVSLVCSRRRRFPPPGHRVFEKREGGFVCLLVPDAYYITRCQGELVSELRRKCKRIVNDRPGRSKTDEMSLEGEIPMHNELTREDLKLMQEELDHRRIVLRPQLIEAVKEARAFGDLSENFEYKAAKRERGRNESRIRFLENMIKTAVVIEDKSGADTVGLYDKVTVYLEDDDETETYQIVTTMRQDALRGYISKESPVGRAMLGKKVGDRFYIKVREDFGYYMVIRAIEKGTDDGSIELSSY